MEKYFKSFQEMPLPAVILCRGRLEENRNQAFMDTFGRGTLDGGGTAAGLERGPDMDARLYQEIAEDLRGLAGNSSRPRILEKNILFPGNEPKTFRVRLSRLSGDEDSVLAIFTDITERRKHLEEISRLASIVDSSDDAILSVSPDHRILSWNNGAHKIYGYHEDDVLRSSAMKLFAQAVGEDLSSLFARVLAGESFMRHETVCCHQDGHLFPVSMTLSPLRDHDGGAGITGITMITRDISSRRHAEEKLLTSHRQLQNLMHETVESLSMAHEKRDLYTAGHQRTVSLLGSIVADELNLSRDEIEGVRIAGLLHDIGKVCIPMAILSKPAALSPEEMALIARHPVAGYEIVKNIPFICSVKEAILQHHERMDASGYPGGLGGDDICVEARILAVADVLEAMSSHRPYRPALGLDAALEEIGRNAGVKYDSDVCRVATRLFEGGALRIENGRLACLV